MSKSFATLVALSAVSIPLLAALPTSAADTPPGGVSIELNKLESHDKGCRAYMVVNNASDTTYQSYKLDLVLFQADGVIGRRFALDLSPLRPQKKTVKLFELDAMACDKIGSFLINDVMECKTDAGAATDCLKGLATSSLTTVQISK